MMVKGLVWDDWNREHLASHKVTIEEVEEVCHGRFKVGESYRKRIVLDGKTKKGKMITLLYHSYSGLHTENLYCEAKYFVLYKF